jgi:hypothetical protein
MASMSHVAIDGSVVETTFPSGGLPPSFTSEAMASLGVADQLFCAGRLGHAAEVASEPDFGVVTFEQEYRHQGGRLRMGWGELPASGDGAEYLAYGADGRVYPVRRWFASWEGRAFSVHAQVMGHDQAGHLLTVFDNISIS